MHRKLDIPRLPRLTSRPTACASSFLLIFPLLLSHTDLFTLDLEALISSAYGSVALSSYCVHIVPCSVSLHCFVYRVCSRLCLFCQRGYATVYVSVQCERVMFIFPKPHSSLFPISIVFR